MFPNFERHTIDVGGIHINCVKGGSGPALLLLHGHPQTHAIWHKVAPQLAERYTVIAADLRGYGDSGKPPGLPDHSNYSKRVMAEDQLRLMRRFGHDRFLVLAHDRGARVAYRMALDHPQAVERLVTLDIAPTLAMYEQTSQAFATAYYHWFFLIRPAPFPETLINSHPGEYLKHTIGGRSAGLAPFTDAAYAEYLRCLQDPATVHGICEDYRASAGIDLDHERADLAAGNKITCPMLALWGAHGTVGKCFDPLAEWQALAADVRGHALDCGHYIPEEAPQALLDQVLPFFDH
ncbi:alpha/beta fold hydrolase [Duganella aceris]|uniref:Alpha/beta hydrolase n=1 Tax=Duganella aceris TaxID=2703883 RepID=A0ABX0FSL0_9BURK|nr:alpha/beta hydrolase [Duganella aceris]NGZ87670.1 alpha/beta hydrolase [Duganella aceris]